MAFKQKEDLGYTVVDGEVLPSYEGEINGPRYPGGALMAEVDKFLYPDVQPDPVDYEFEERMGRINEIVADIRQTGLPIDLASELPAEYERNTPHADLGGGVHAVSRGELTRASFGNTQRRTNPGRRRRSNQQAIANARRHEALARRQRWGST